MEKNSGGRIGWRRTKTAVSLVSDVTGKIPGVGIVASVTNHTVYGVDSLIGIATGELEIGWNRETFDAIVSHIRYVGTALGIWREVRSPKFTVEFCDA